MHSVSAESLKVKQHHSREQVIMSEPLAIWDHTVLPSTRHK